MMRSIIDISSSVSDGRKQLRSLASISRILVHRVGVDLRGNVVIGYDAESICDAFTGMNPLWRSVWSATGRQNPYSIYIGGDLGGGNDGVMWQALDLTEVGWHARSASRSSIGIAMIGDFRHGCGRMPSRAQMSSLVWVVSSLCSALDIDASRVLGHGEVPEAHGGEKAPGASHACPGGFVDMDRVRSAVAAAAGPSCQISARQVLHRAGLSFG